MDFLILRLFDSLHSSIIQTTDANSAMDYLSLRLFDSRYSPLCSLIHTCKILQYHATKVSTIYRTIHGSTCPWVQLSQGSTCPGSSCLGSTCPGATCRRSSCRRSSTKTSTTALWCEGLTQRPRQGQPERKTAPRVVHSAATTSPLGSGATRQNEDADQSQYE
jgi:hypothetical protein